MSSRKTRLSVKEHQKLKVLLDAIEDSGEGDIPKAEKQEQPLIGEAGCVNEAEIQRLIDLGLGRGIDASNPTPWQNKTSIQVRPVTFENIIGTEESGSIQSYEREITRVSETHWRFSSSAVFNPNLAATFAIGVEESPPRSSSSKKYIVGTKVLNRTICFREICDDCNSLDFEVWLCRWILKQFVKEDGKPVDIDEKIEVLKQELVVVSEEFEALQGEFRDLKSKHEAAEAENVVESIQAELQELEHKQKMNQMEKEKLESKKKWFLNSLEKEYKKTGQSDEKQYKLEEFDQDFKLQEIKVNKESSEMERRIALLKERSASETSRLEELEGRLTATKEAMEEKERVLKAKKDEMKKVESHKFTINEFRNRLDSDELQPNKIADYCAQFLAQFRVTHYVSSIQLGASGYKIISKSKDTKSQKVRSSITIDKIAAGKETSSSSRSKLRGPKSSGGGGSVNKIGIIEIEEDNKIVVKRRSHQEGVVGVQVKPISDLVTTKELRETLKAGLLHYVRSEGDTNGYNYTDGPFSIHCQIDEKTFYWTVDDFHTVRAEDCSPEEAAKFYIKPRSHPEHLNEFYVVYYDSENKKHADPFVPHYLQRSVTIFDSGANQSLMFGHYSPDKDTPLALYKPVAAAAESALNGSLLSIPHMRSTLRRNRRREKMTSVSLSSWIAEPEVACVIQHAKQSLTSASPFIVAVAIPSPIPDPEQQPESKKQSDRVQNENEVTPQHEESEQVAEEQQQEGTQESQEVEQEMQESQEVQEVGDAQGQGSLPGERQEETMLVVASEPVIGRSVHQVVWMEASDSSRVGAVKMFEIVPVQNN